MAVTITREQISEELGYPQEAGLPADDPKIRGITRWLELATEWIESYAPDAPEVFHNEAAVRVCGYLAQIPDGPYESLNIGGAGATYPSGSRAVFRHSGAMGLLSSYKARRAGVVG